MECVECGPSRAPGPGQSHGNLPSFRSTSILVSSSLHLRRPPKIAYQFTAVPRLYVNLQLNFPAHSFPVILRTRTSNFFHLYKNVYTYASCRCYVYVCKWNGCKYVLFEIRNEDSGEKFFIFHVHDYIAKIMRFSQFFKNSIFTLLLTLIILFSIFHVPDYVAEKCNFLSLFKKNRVRVALLFIIYIVLSFFIYQVFK